MKLLGLWMLYRHQNCLAVVCTCYATELF